jgi:hypothetical protein
MPKRRFAIYAVLASTLLLTACGQVDPSVSAPGAGDYQVTGVPAWAVATTGGPSSARSASPTEAMNTPVRLAMNAAIAFAKTTMHATHPNVAEASQGLFDTADPKSNVWVVHLMDDTFQLPPCPPGTPQTTYARTCGSGTDARLGLNISDLTVEYAEVYGAGTPIAQAPITLPPNAKLPTRETAIEAALGGAPVDSNSPHVVSVDLILAGQDSTVRGLPPDTPIWRISLDHGQFEHSCPPGAPPSACGSTSTTMWIEAITGMLRTQSYPMATPTS